MNFLGWLLIALAVAYCGLLALMFAFQRRLMYFPGPRCAAPAPCGLPEAKEIQITSGDGERLVAWYVAPHDENPLTIYFQDNAGGLDLRVDRFRALIAGGIGLLALCYRGYGGSSGRPTEKGLLLDARAAYDFAAARVTPNRIYCSVNRLVPLLPWRSRRNTRSARSFWTRRLRRQRILVLPHTLMYRCAG